MKIKDLIKKLQEQNPESEIFMHRFDDYHLTPDFDIKQAWTNDESLENLEKPFLFWDRFDEETDCFQAEIVILTNTDRFK